MTDPGSCPLVELVAKTRVAVKEAGLASIAPPLSPLSLMACVVPQDLFVPSISYMEQVCDAEPECLGR